MAEDRVGKRMGEGKVVFGWIGVRECRLEGTRGSGLD